MEKKCTNCGSEEDLRPWAWGKVVCKKCDDEQSQRLLDIALGKVDYKPKYINPDELED